MSKRGRSLIIALVICFLLQIAMPLMAVAASPSYTLVDIVRVARALCGSANLSAEQQAYYDANGDGRVNILDLAQIAEAVLAATSAQNPSAGPQGEPAVCPDCQQYPCACHTVQAPAGQPTVCPDCQRYPCVCQAAQAPAGQPTVCPSCSRYPCICQAGSSALCSVCHSDPCICGGCDSGGQHHSGGHHGYGHC